jgi:hypothetical protein
MKPRRESSIAPVLPERQRRWKDLRAVAVVAASLGGILVLAVLLSRQRRFVEPAATAESPTPQPAVGNLSVVDEPRADPTYPIPPEVIAALRARKAASAPIAPTTPPVNESKRAPAPSSRARDRAVTRRVVPSPHGESRTGITRATAPISAASSSPSAATAIARPPPSDRTATPVSSASAAETRKRIPLVDDQPRVRILE